jgi:hypothetical protein
MSAEHDSRRVPAAVDGVRDRKRGGLAVRSLLSLKPRPGCAGESSAVTTPNRGDLWVSECVITYDGATTHSVSILEFTDGLLMHETQYFADPFQAPPSRTPLAEPIPGRD